jgi:transaldolase
MDFISRGMILSGELRQLIEEDGLRGVTSNPAIFEKAISESHDYDDAVLALDREGKSAREMYEELTVKDIQRQRICSVRFTTGWRGGTVL